MNKEQLLLILAAGKPHKGELPSALTGTGNRGRVLDCALQAFEDETLTPHLVLGYQSEEISALYPGISHTVNEQWSESRSAESFLLAPISGISTCYVCYSDILFRKSTVQELSGQKAPIVVAVDSHWRSRYQGRTKEDVQRCEKVVVVDGHALRLGADISSDTANAEFIGLAKFSHDALELVEALPESTREMLRLADISGLIEFLRLKGLQIDVVDVAGDWAEMNVPEDFAHFILGTKAQTLFRLRGLVKKSRIEDVFLFTLDEWRNDPSDVIARVKKQLGPVMLVVRSSALSEDSFASANAGAYDSVLDVNGNDESALKNAIDTVISSYPDDHPDHQVLVQPMVQNVVSSGVVFTRSLASGSPYRVFNYEESSSTDSITSGSSKDHKTLVMHRDASSSPLRAGETISPLLDAVVEIEELLNFDSLDIEFAICRERVVHILQVRPIAVDHGDRVVSDTDVKDLLAAAQSDFRSWQRATPFVLGKRAIFGVMPDWNPAEIIGTKPGKLAMTLYRKLIMDDAWSTQRQQYGYRDVRPEPLLVIFAGHPYVNVRASFNSFIPASLNDSLAERLVNFYLDWLIEHPQLHDKVEFEVVPTSIGLDFSEKEVWLQHHGGFQLEEIAKLRSSLIEITNAAMQRTEDDLRRVEILVDRYHKLMQSNVGPLDRAAMLLQDCRRYGTVAFSHLARSAFVGVSLLKSAVKTGVLSASEQEAFFNSVRTVTHMFVDDSLAVAGNELEWAEFVVKYGHLRPGTYDITAHCYADDPEKYLRPIVKKAQEAHINPSSEWTSEALARLCAAMGRQGLSSDPGTVETFLRTAIEGREYAKFVFTRNLSSALDCLVEFGKHHELDRQMLANLDIEDLLSLRVGTVVTSDQKEWLASRASEGARWRQIASTIELPPLLVEEEEFYSFLYPNNQPNYIGSGAITANTADLTKYDDDDSPGLSGKIAIIPQADPGYDWLFGQNIGGLITMYGGANSHMAIRAAEFGLPAAIGVGETLYNRIANARVVVLDCANRRIEVVY